MYECFYAQFFKYIFFKASLIINFFYLFFIETTVQFSLLLFLN
jgi:hypothetical protein